MFNATELRARAKHTPRLDSYFKSNSFAAVLNGLIKDQVPEDEIMRTQRGPQGYTQLHDLFFLSFMAWLGGEMYYKALKKFSTYPDTKDTK